MGRLFKLDAVSQIAQIDSENESEGSKMMWSDKVYWQVADTRRRGPKDWSLQGRLSWEKKTFILLSSFQRVRVVQGMMMNLITYL